MLNTSLKSVKRFVGTRVGISLAIALILVSSTILGTVLGSNFLGWPVEGTFQVAVDQAGHIRLLGPDIEGQYHDKLRENELLIELPSRQLVATLENTLNERGSTITQLQSRLSELENRVSELESNSGGSGSSDNIVQEGLVLWLPLDEGQGAVVKDKSGFGNDGVIAGATWIQLPNGLWHLNFDGIDDHVDVSASPSLKIGNDNESYSVLVWLNSSDTSSEIALRIGTSSTYAGQLEKVRGGKFQFIVYDGVNFPYLRTNTVVADGVWHLVAAVRDGSSDQLLIYLDGVQDAAPVTDTAGDTRDSTGVCIGYDRFGFWFTGDIAQVGIYNRALSPSEMEQNYLATRGRYP